MAIGKIGLYWGDTLMQREQEQEWLCNNYIQRGDVILLSGSEKSGKSILSLQLASNLSNGSQFLGKYSCKESKVLYIQLEGKVTELVDRLECMQRAIPHKAANLARIYQKFLPLDEDIGINALERTVKALPWLPDVIIIDPLYMSLSGDLNSNESIRTFLFKVAPYIDNNKFTTIFIHHSKRDTYGQDGSRQELGDKSIYGSVFLRAFVDHLLFLDMKQDKSRVLTCDTQRSGKITEREELILIQPSPLFFKIRGELSPSEERILELLKHSPYSKPDLIALTELSEKSVRDALHTLLQHDLINITDLKNTKTGSPEKIYGVIPCKGVG